MKSYINEISAIKSASKTEQSRIHDSYRLRSDDLEKSGAHRDKVRDLWEECSAEKSKIDSAEYLQLLNFKLHSMLCFEPVTLFPFHVLDMEMVLVKVNDYDAFLLFNTCKWKVTSYKLKAGGLSFSFMCGCENCDRDLKNGLRDIDTIMRAIAPICVQHRIKNVVMRHCNGWPYGLAESLGFELREI